MRQRVVGTDIRGGHGGKGNGQQAEPVPWVEKPMAMAVAGIQGIYQSWNAILEVIINIF